MALKPTIYRAQIALADSDRNCFDSLSLTLAQHPSETLERMTARLLAYCLHCTRGLEFTRGLAAPEEPDLWVRSDNGEITQWIEVGQPEQSRLRKACGRARKVSIYAFGKSTATWWNLQARDISALPRLSVWQLDWREIQGAAALLERSMQLHISIVGGVLYFANGNQSVSVEPKTLYQNRQAS